MPAKTPTQSEQLHELYCKLGFKGDVSAKAKSQKIASTLTRRTFTHQQPSDLIADVKRMLGKLQPPELRTILQGLDNMFPAPQPPRPRPRPRAKGRRVPRMP